jgi:hypothetical protein
VIYLLCPFSSEGYDKASFRGLVPVSGESRERERRTGTKLLAVFLQHICTNVNTQKHQYVKRSIPKAS